MLYYFDLETPNVFLSMKNLKGQVKWGVDETYCYQNEVISASGSCRNSRAMVCSHCSLTKFSLIYSKTRIIRTVEREDFIQLNVLHLKGLILCSFYLVGVKMSFLSLKNA